MLYLVAAYVLCLVVAIWAFYTTRDPKLTLRSVVQDYVVGVPMVALMLMVGLLLLPAFFVYTLIQDCFDSKKND